jgi:hypothetical protein
MNMVKNFWQRRDQAMQLAIKVGEKSLEKGTVYIYRLASVYYEAAFARYLLGADSNWLEALNRSLELFRRSSDSGDCENRIGYPYNLAQLYLEWYLGLFWSGSTLDESLLDKSIDTYVQALWKEEKQSLTNLSVLPPCYLLHRDRVRLTKFWEMIANDGGTEKLPPEMDFWYRLSNIYLEKTVENSPLSDQFMHVYQNYLGKLKDPSTQSAKFFSALAKIGKDSFGLKENLPILLNKLAVELWER